MSTKNIIHNINLKDFMEQVVDWHYDQTDSDVFEFIGEDANITSSVEDVVSQVLDDIDDEDVLCDIGENIVADIEKTLNGEVIDDQSIDDIQPFSDRLIVYEDFSFEFVKTKL